MTLSSHDNISDPAQSVHHYRSSFYLHTQLDGHSPHGSSTTETRRPTQCKKQNKKTSCHTITNWSYLACQIEVRHQHHTEKWLYEFQIAYSHRPENGYDLSLVIKNLFMRYANNKDTDQRLRCSLLSYYNTSTCYSRNFNTLAGLCS